MQIQPPPVEPKPLYKIGKLGPTDPQPPAISGYWVMSTAPIEVEQKEPQLSDSTPPVALRLLAKQLCAQPDPTLLVHVHGYNTNETQALQRALHFQQLLGEQTTPNEKESLFFVNYRWPSQSAFFSRALALPLVVAFMPGPVVVMALLGVVVVTLGLVMWWPHQELRTLLFWTGILIFAFGCLLVALTTAVAVFRISEYWRDTYRANQYGVPDLVSFFQDLDEAMEEVIQTRQKTDPVDDEYIPPAANHVRLSFLAHSMGSQVVTGLVRILSDVFDSKYNAAKDRSNPKIGKHLKLHRLTLVSPDIPAEALLSRRANFLDASLRRFEEAYLITNQMDAALWNVSTIANSFVFPAKKIVSGYRLGNVAIDLKEGVHIADAKIPDIFTALYLGTPFWNLFGKPRTLLDIQGLMGTDGEKTTKEKRLADRFVYIEATDFHEGKQRPLSLPWFRRNRWWLAHFVHLLAYPLGRPDSHSGYFSTENLLRLILQTSHHGLKPDTGVQEKALGAWAEEHGVRILFGKDTSH